MSAATKYSQTPLADEEHRYADGEDGVLVTPSGTTAAIGAGGGTAVQAMEVLGSDQGDSFQRGELQEPEFRDKWFGIVFVLHLVVMIAVSAMYATGTLKVVPPDRRRLFRREEEGEENETIGWLLFGFGISVLIAPVLSIGIMTFMKRNAQLLIQFSLYFSIGFNAVLAFLFLTSNSPGAAALPIFFCLVLVCYAKAVWHRIPFAAANIRTAISVVQDNLGMAFLALGNIPLVTCWFFLWAFVAGSVLNSPWFQAQESYNAAAQGQDDEASITPQGWAAFFGLLLSFYWTLQVLQNVVHTTLAGTVGTWWFVPHEANRCCSRGLTDSLCRSMSYSFGSICLGSLIVAIIEALRSILKSRSQRGGGGGGLLRLISQCLLYWIERVAKYFNKWAFVYVGLYGYSYVQAGKNVIALFQNRGWTAIISDSLVVRMLFMMSFCVGCINALVTSLVTWIVLLSEDGNDYGDAIVAVALWALFVGLLLSNLVFRVLISAVDSIIVLFAEAPREFDENHPELAREMQDTWSQAWPDIFSPMGTNTTAAAAVVVDGSSNSEMVAIAKAEPSPRSIV